MAETNETLSEVRERLKTVEAENRMLKTKEENRGLKINPPEEFKGDRRQTETFLLQCRAYFDANPTQYPTSRTQVKYATNLLRGEAFEWFKHIMRDYLLNETGSQDAETVGIYANWENFEAALRTVYGELDEERTAELQLQKLTQGGSAADYSAKFQRLATKTQWNDEALVAGFYRGLKENIKDDLTRMDSRPTTLAGMIETAIRIDNRYYERKLEKTGGKPLFFGHKKTIPRAPYYGPMPMELGSTRKVRHGNTREELKRQESREGTQTKFRELREKSKQECFNCGQRGHWARECKKPRKERKQVNEVHKTPDKHGLLSWTACYDDSCQIHESSKDGAGWYPRKPRKTLNMMSKRVTVKSEKETLRPLTNEEFEEKAKKIEGLHEEAKKVADRMEREKEEELESDSELEELADPDGEPATKTQVATAVSWLDQQAYYRHEKLMDRVSRLIVDLGIHNGTLSPVGTGSSRGTQTVRQGIFLEEYVPTGSRFTKGGTYVTPDGMVVPEQLRQRVRELARWYQERDPVANPEVKADFRKIDKKQFCYVRDPLEPVHSKN